MCTKMINLMQRVLVSVVCFDAQCKLGSRECAYSLDVVDKCFVV